MFPDCAAVADVAVNRLLSLSPSGGHSAEVSVKVSPDWSVHLKVMSSRVPACHSLFPEVRPVHGTDIPGRLVLPSYV